MIETVEKKYNPISNEFDTYKIIKDNITSF